MGGGDLNSKKSWHPNTIKNQERVWKAEQAAAEEKKRITEIQHEHALERDRETFNDMAKSKVGLATGCDSSLNWMYNKPKKEDQESYLLGTKQLDKNSFNDDNAEEGISAIRRRVVGSSMLTAAEDTQVDLARKLKEDPLIIIKERERAARAALLNNPLQRRRLTELLRKEQESQQKHKMKKKSKKKTKELDNILATKLNALGGKNIDLASLLESDDSDSSSSSKKKPKKKKKSKKSKKSKSSDTESKYSESDRRDKSKYNNKESESSISTKVNTKKLKKRKSDEYHDYQSTKPTQVCTEKESKKRKSDEYHEYQSSKPTQCTEKESKKRKSDEYHEYQSKRNKYTEKTRDDGDTEKREYNSTRKNDHPSSQTLNAHKARGDQYNKEKQKKVGMSEEERASRLAAMVADGASRERARERRVARLRAQPDDERAARAPGAGPAPAPAPAARTLPDSLEKRIHSNRHYIQRNKQHMNEHFARR